MNHNIIFLILTIMLFGCKKTAERICFKGNGEALTIDIENEKIFNEIELFDDINLILINDSLNFTSITGPVNLIEFVELNVENNLLSIRNLNKCDFLRSEKEINIHFHYTNLNKVNLSGYGNLSNYDTLKHNIIINANNAYSNINLTINSDSVQVYLLKGSTSLSLAGFCNSLYGYNSGIAPFNASLLTSKKVHINSNSIARTDIIVIENLNAEIRSYGDIYYSGSPLTTNFSITGEGKIIQL